MKNITSLKLGLIALLLMSTLFACNVFDYPELEDPLSIKITDLEGSWSVSKVTQFDQEAIDNGFPEEVQKREITNSFPFSEYGISFSLDSEGRPSEFTVNTGAAPNFLSLTSGSWNVDHPVFTTEIRLFDVTNPESASFRVKKIAKDVIALQLLRNADDAAGTLYTFYEYEFTKN